MKLSHLFDVSPFLALSFCVCLGTVLWCTILLRRGCHHRADRLLIGFIGLLSMYQCAQILRRGGVLLTPDMRQLDEAVALMVNSFFLLAAVLLRVSNRDRSDGVLTLRLAEARSFPHKSDASRQAGLGDPHSLETIRSVADTLSSHALKLYLHICFHADQKTDLLGTTEDQLVGLLSCDEKALFSAFEELRAQGLCYVEPARPADSSDPITLSIAQRSDFTMPPTTGANNDIHKRDHIPKLISE